MRKSLYRKRVSKVVCINSMKYYATKISDKGNIAVDDTILVKDVECTAGSRILEGFKPLFSAEAVTRLEEKGYAVSGKRIVIQLIIH